ncbi:MAG: hypothetical protein ACO1RX_02685 [Candidatus Sericytochromatia bacterium]
MGSFRTELINRTQDGVLDRSEWKALRELGQQSIATKQADSWLAEHAIPYLDGFSESTQIRYGIPGKSLSFNFTPHYSESELLPGDNMRTKLSHVAQRDTLGDTDSDGSRCGAASLLNSYLLLNQPFEKAAEQLKLPSDQRSLTYGNLHRAQHALYQSANTDGEDGLTSSFGYTHRAGKIESRSLHGEIASGLKTLGLTGRILTGPTTERLHDRTEAVTDFWKQHPQGTLLVGVYLDTTSGELQSIDGSQRQNHFVTVFREGETAYLLDTGASDNGAGNSLRTLNADELKAFVHTTQGHVIGVHR